MSFDLFGPATKCDIRVGYISTDRGFVDRVGVHDANQYAKLNPGTIFIFRNREKVQYLNINQVNRLQPSDMLPVKNAGEGGACGKEHARRFPSVVDQQQHRESCARRSP